ncbi:hypothetical protein N9W79_01890, partial [bacterium]|nr:hypothetical protein [bacterium]
ESVDVTPRYRSWTFTGPVTTSSDFSVLPINEVAVNMRRSLNTKMKYTFGGLAGYGSTDSGSSFFAYGANGSGYWIDRLPMKLPIFQFYKAGGKTKYDGRSVSSGQYGGHDIVTVGFFGGLEGEQRVGATRVGFDADFTYIPITFGRVGYSGTQKSAKSSNGITKKGRRVLNWGAGFTYGKHLIVNDASEETNDTELTVEAIARWRF